MTTRYGDSKFDIRTLKANLRGGKLTHKEVAGYLKELPDESKNAEEVPLFEEKTQKKPSGKQGSKEQSGKEPTFAFAVES